MTPKQIQEDLEKQLLLLTEKDVKYINDTYSLESEDKIVAEPTTTPESWEECIIDEDF